MTTTTKRQCLECGATLKGHRHEYCIRCGCHDSASGFDSSPGPFARCTNKADYQLSGQPMQGKHDPQVCEAHLPLNGNLNCHPRWNAENGGMFSLINAQLLPFINRKDERKAGDWRTSAFYVEYIAPGGQHIRYPFNGTVATAAEARSLANDWLQIR